MGKNDRSDIRLAAHHASTDDDPAFNGKSRELIADDYIYAYKRWLDPNGRRGGSPVLTDLIMGRQSRFLRTDFLF